MIQFLQIILCHKLLPGDGYSSLFSAIYPCGLSEFFFLRSS